MADTKVLIERAHSAFNKRDIDGALALMTQDVSWPKASEGGKVIGKEAIRAYWTRQWSEFEPHVEPLAITVGAGGELHVKCAKSSRAFRGYSFRRRGSSRVHGQQRPNRRSVCRIRTST